ncbi:hypothetical protein Tco_0809125 [Tanacetum coccineum]
MDAKFIIQTQTCTLTKSELSQLVVEYGIPLDVRVMLLKRNQTIFDAPLGFVGLYTRSFNHLNLRIPFPKFFCEVLNYFKVHISHFNPFGLAKLTAFAVMCKAYGDKPIVKLLRAFLNLVNAGNWLTLSNRGDANVPRAIKKPCTHIEGWKVKMYFRSFMMEGINGEFHFLTREDIGNKGGADLDDAPSERDEVVLIDCSISKKAKNRKESAPSKVANKRKQAASKPSGRETRHKTHKVQPQASKAVGEPSDPFDVDKFPSAKELKDSADYYRVVAYVTPPLWKHHLKEISLEKLCDNHDKAYMRQVVLDNKKDKAYAELEAKCNDALQDLEKNPLVLDLHKEIETLQGQVEKLHGEYSRLDRAAVVVKDVPPVAMDLVCSDEMGLLVTRLARRLLFMVEFDQAGDSVSTASYPFLVEATVDPYAPLEEQQLPSFRLPSLDDFSQSLLHALDVVPVYDLYLSIYLRMVDGGEGLEADRLVGPHWKDVRKSSKLTCSGRQPSCFDPFRHVLLFNCEAPENLLCLF